MRSDNVSVKKERLTTAAYMTSVDVTFICYLIFYLVVGAVVQESFVSILD
jgi:hypothetical protein